MSYKKAAARAVAPLLVAALLGTACGKKGPLYLPGQQARAPAPPVAAAPLLARRDAR